MKQIPVIDLFSGAGGMSCGFSSNKNFHLVGAVDAEKGKPSSKESSLECNSTYFRNIGLEPLNADLFDIYPDELAKNFNVKKSFEGVLIACPPCTDFSRAKPKNHGSDGHRNLLTSRLANILKRFRPKFFAYENAREALDGPNKHHLESVINFLEKNKYSFRAKIVDFSKFGLPQRRERVIILAARDKEIKFLDDLWEGYELAPNITNVRGALKRLTELRVIHPASYDERYPNLTLPVLKRIQAIPADGGSWTDIAGTHADLLIPSMQQKIRDGKLGSYPDVYGRMSLDRLAPTIKRECGHVGNGRYTHPTEHRLMNISEMAILQGFPITYTFAASGLVNCYRQIGDAVPPFISFQLAALIQWIDTDKRPSPEEFILPSTAISHHNIVKKEDVLKSRQDIEELNLIA